MKQPIVLDSFALVSLFHREPGSDQVKGILSELAASEEKALLSRINWGEFYYVVRRRVGDFRTREALSLLEQLPIQVLSVDDDLVKAAAEIKADYPVAYADAFCIATARRVNGRIVTHDPEFKAVENLVPILWLKNPPL
ncbi:MAG: type II toxin-antitoxin system VapC family toxin [Thermodesulfobacteriota bacterium]